MKLNDYFQKYIFQPLGIESIGMFPTENMRANLMSMYQRQRDGQFGIKDHTMRQYILADTEEERKRLFNAGGHGCFASPRDYVSESQTSKPFSPSCTRPGEIFP
jgi:CubicO group peptidase (beta-lactamase class C family)